MNIRRRSWIGLGGIVAIALFFVVQWDREQPFNDKERPDIILVVVDTLRADYLGCYGFRGDISPAIDRLAGESILYDNAIAPSPWTKPSTASLFTSLDPLTHRVVDHEDQFWNGVATNRKTDALPKEAWTLAEALSELGYDTVAWSANPWISAVWGFDQGFDRFHERHGVNADAITREAQEWLEAAPKRSRGDIPLFLYLHLMDVHGPYQSTLDLVEKFSKSPSVGEDQILTAHQFDQLKYLGDSTPWRDSDRGRKLTNWRAAYAGGVRLFDDRLGPFLDWLRTSDRFGKSLIILTSDHGEDLLEHGRWNHGAALFQHSLRVPLMVRLPEVKGGGRRDEAMTGLLDVMPTILQLAGVDVLPQNAEGRPLLDSNGRKTKDTADWSYSGAVTIDPRMVSIQNRDHKLIWEFPTGNKWLFDLRNDPDEQRNLASGALAAVEEKMTRVLSDRTRRLNAEPSLLRRGAEVDSKALERLRSLGYIN